MSWTHMHGNLVVFWQQLSHEVVEQIQSCLIPLEATEVDHLPQFHSISSIFLLNMSSLTTPMNLHCVLPLFSSIFNMPC